MKAETACPLLREQINHGMLICTKELIHTNMKESKTYTE